MLVLVTVSVIVSLLFPIIDISDGGKLQSFLLPNFCTDNSDNSMNFSTISVLCRLHMNTFQSQTHYVILRP